MSVCKPCKLQSLVDGVLSFPSDERVHISLFPKVTAHDGRVEEEPRSFEGEADLEFLGEDGSFSVVIPVRGNFGVSPREDFEDVDALVEAFSVDGERAFIQVTVQREDGSAVFAGNLRPTGDNGEIGGIGFHGWGYEEEAMLT
jgi:hypothetical protein